MNRTAFLSLAALAVILAAAAPCAAAEAPGQPLFPVGLGFKFPGGRQAFDEARALILKNYYSPEIDEETLYYAAIAGMLRRVSPPDNPEMGTLWTERQYADVKNTLRGERVSLGIEGQFNSADGSLAVTGTMPGSSAEKALLPFDRILRVDGVSLQGRTFEDAKAALDGAEGSTVTLTVARDIKVFDVTLRRTKFAERNLVVTPLTADIALLEVKRFAQGISGEIRSALAGLEGGKFKSIVIDLRNDPGGVFWEGVQSSALFLPAKSLILRTYTRGEQVKDYASENPRPFPFQLAVLTNRVSTSAAELMAGALRDHGAAFIVGARTQGKGVMETTYSLKNGFQVKFITGAMYGPGGAAWQGKGILPDFFVDQDEKTVAALARLPIQERLTRDDAILTAIKVLLRDRKK